MVDVRLCATPAKENAHQEIEAIQGCCGEERSMGGETAHQPTEHRSRDHPEPETGAHEAEVPRALIPICDIGNIGAGYRTSRPGDAGHDAPDIENPKERRRRHDGVVDSGAGQRDEQDRPPAETIR
uniref:Uncharacterized protein n=1 Tax=Leclercia adecarboxylata TaxID=83655 RepID=A0A2Z2E0Q1_9ENTR|nr:Hypothetical protein [Leclercia adecarboxylata]